MENLTIGAVAQQAGLRTSTIRYYESIDLLPPPRRVSGQRRYDPAILERLAFIQATQQLGFTLSEIQQLLQAESGETSLPQLWESLIQQKMSELERVLQQAQAMKQQLTMGLRCGCAQLADCIDCVLGLGTDLCAGTC